MIVTTDGPTASMISSCTGSRPPARRLRRRSGGREPGGLPTCTRTAVVVVDRPDEHPDEPGDECRGTDIEYCWSLRSGTSISPRAGSAGRALGRRRHGAAASAPGVHRARSHAAAAAPGQSPSERPVPCEDGVRVWSCLRNSDGYGQAGRGDGACCPPRSSGSGHRRRWRTWPAPYLSTCEHRAVHLRSAASSAVSRHACRGDRPERQGVAGDRVAAAARCCTWCRRVTSRFFKRQRMGAHPGRRRPGRVRRLRARRRSRSRAPARGRGRANLVVEHNHGRLCATIDERVAVERQGRARA